MNKLERAREIQQMDGTATLLRRTLKFLTAPVSRRYNRYVWPYIPTTADYGTYNDVRVYGTNPVKLDSTTTDIRHRYLDRLVPWDTPSYIPEFKRPNVTAVNECCRYGDTIVVVGGGYGITAVHAAKQVGRAGEVLVYEGDTEMVENLRLTFERNGVSEICQVIPAVVGEPYRIEQYPTENVISSADLPQSDVLEMDCEGAELDILQRLAHRPKTIIVELHHEKTFSPYSSAQTIRTILEDRGYRVEHRDGLWVDGLFMAWRAE